MVVGNPKNDYTYYEGYEGEGEIVLCLESGDSIHIWEGFFDDIYATPALDGRGWNGFTRDYHQFEGIFSDNNGTTEINPAEYLEDLMQYQNKLFDFDETVDVFNLMASTFQRAIKDGKTIKVERI